jgi:hypothetical protein
VDEDNITHMQSTKPPKSETPAAMSMPHPDFWYSDGSVILEVGNTKFKLHRTVLQRHSAYFFSLFQKEATYFEVEKGIPNATIPVYRVSETTADDFATLLDLTENPMTYILEFVLKDHPMPLLARILRAAYALSFGVERIWAGVTVEHMWPPTLDRVTDKVIPYASIALELARTCRMHKIGKRASYELLRMPAFGQSTATASSGADADLGALPHADLLHLLRAREQLCLIWAEVAGKAPAGFPCLQGRVHTIWTELVHTSGIFAKGMIDPLMGLQKLIDIPWEDRGVCRKCVEVKVKEWTELRRKLWADLDVWMELTTE